MKVDRTAIEISGKFSYDFNTARNSFEELWKNEDLQSPNPVLIDISYSDTQTFVNRCQLHIMLEKFHDVTGCSTQVGVARTFPFSSRIIHGFTTEQLHDMILVPYGPDKFGMPGIADQVQYIPCWAYPYTTDASAWCTTVKTQAELAVQFHKPIYACTSILYHQGVPHMRGKLVDVDRFSWMIQRLYEYKYDGIIINSQETTINPSGPYYEMVNNLLNQINE